jgi:hypothetical protein
VNQQDGIKKRGCLELGVLGSLEAAKSFGLRLWGAGLRQRYDPTGRGKVGQEPGARGARVPRGFGLLRVREMARKTGMHDGRCLPGRADGGDDTRTDARGSKVSEADSLAPKTC